MRTTEKLNGLVAELVSNYGDLYKACRSQCVSPMFVAQWRKDDPQVDETLTEAQRAGAMGLKSAAIDRAVHGIERGVYYKGEEIAVERHYSDGLLTKLMEAGLDEFKKGEGGAISNTFNGPVQINSMPRAASYEEWLMMKDATHAAVKSLPAPIEQTIDAEFASVAPSPQFAGLGL